MSPQELALFLSVLAACAVEAVEALTIVLAVGLTRGWPSTFAGVGVACAVLVVVVAALGSTLTTLPIDVLRLAIGGLLLLFGLRWLRKAILRSAGLKSLHDESEAFVHELEAARAAERSSESLDRYAFAIAFKGVLLEGVEVVFIVLTIGANQHHLALATAAAALAVVLVVAAGIATRAPLARVPENTMKFAVGVMLTSFGVFWVGEGAGVSWPGSDAALLVIIPVVLLVSLATVRALRRQALVSS
ncbi:MAG TPA: hypothetical protein VGY76_02815 [Solirubrobacteraceae bacterium]|jgi:uncharacterized membrane protein|nr:hypothetical protein [Solirubrobacteraceae bacterium]